MGKFGDFIRKIFGKVDVIDGLKLGLEVANAYKDIDAQTKGITDKTIKAKTIIHLAKDKVAELHPNEYKALMDALRSFVMAKTGLNAAIVDILINEVLHP